MTSDVMLQGQDIVKDFRVRLGLLRGHANLRAVDRVSIVLREGETVGLVGESGSGKSTLGRVLLGLIPPTSGVLHYRGVEFSQLRGELWRRFRADLQAIFQDTSASLNPRRSIGDSVLAPLLYNRKMGTNDARRAADELLERVGLEPRSFFSRLPHQLSGGQRQRVGLARALASRPRVIVADEPVSALDVSVRAQILKLMRELQAQDKLAYLFITHDLGVARLMANRVMVLYLGAVVEEGFADDVFSCPSHPYTQALMVAAPVPDPARQRPPRRLAGDIPSPLTPPSGCTFHPRCPAAQPICRTDAPPVAVFADPRGEHRAKCHFADAVRRARQQETP
jgi:oligopeptide/dipeptide ABC transporter ATP-binding protein